MSEATGTALERARSKDAIKVLLGTPDKAEAQELAAALETGGAHEVTFARDAANAVEILKGSLVFEVVVLDQTWTQPPHDALAAARRTDDVEVIVVSDAGDVGAAVEAMGRGALAFLPRPVNAQELVLHSLRAAERSRLEKEVGTLRRALSDRYGFEGIVGTTPKMRKVIDQLRLAAPTDANVMILGESGTGKELVARSIHWNSPRARGPFVALHLRATPEGLLESELFGHKKGAFTDARADRVGKLESANGGTLFLDELGDMPLETQTKLLRVLETRTFERVGGNEPVRSDFRLITATNQNLKKMIEAKQFREELFFRLNVIPITLPPLRERPGDIPLLVDRFIMESAQQHRKSIEGISAPALRILGRQPWTGNIRELRNCVERMVVLSRGPRIEEEDVPEEYRGVVASEPVAGMGSLAGHSLEEVEREHIRQTLEATGGNRKEAADQLQIGERTLYRKIERYGL